MHYEFSALSDVGRVRSNNEDAVAIHADAGLVLVADGMGGYNAGEVASGMAVQAIGQELRPWLEGAGRGADAAAVRAAVTASVEHANQAILQWAQANPSCAGMGTTLVVGVFTDSQLVLGHIGDSRCYLMRAGGMRQITRDHTWLREQVDSGLLSTEQAEQSGLRGLLTRALGVDQAVQVEINEFGVRPGDLFLFCTDGLTDRLDAAALAALLRKPAPLPALAQRLVRQANDLGGRDNVSVLLVRADGDRA